VSRDLEAKVSPRPLSSFERFFEGGYLVGAVFWSLARTLTRTTATIIPYANQGLRAVYGHTPKKAVSAHAFFPSEQKEGRSGDPHFWTQNCEFWRPPLFTSCFLWKPVYGKEGCMPEREKMYLIDVV